MPYEEEVLEYIESLGRPVTRDEVISGMKGTLEETKVATALSNLSRDVVKQNVRADRGYSKSVYYYLPESWLDGKEKDEKTTRRENMIPRGTAKGICDLSTIEQDIYVQVCHDLCPLFSACADNMKDYFGKSWKYKTNKTDRLKNRFGRQFTSGQ